MRIDSSTGTPLPDRMLSVRVKRALLKPRTFPGARHTIVTSPDRDVLDRAEAAGAEALLDAAGDLNAALAHAAGHAAERGADAILIVPVDLPRAGPEDLLAMATLRHGVIIAPDRHGVGIAGLA